MKTVLKYIFGGLVLLQLACVEAIEIEPEGYENLLVVEATITDEEKHQEITLNRTRPLYEEDEDDENEDETPPPVTESGARVTLVAGDGSSYNFSEDETGHYISDEAFKAEAGVDYRLEIETTGGKLYQSQETTLAQSSSIDNIEAERTTNREEDGVALTIDNINQEESGTNFYKYEYEETYKIVSQFRWNFDLEFIDGELQEVPKTREEEICYNTKYSTDILLANTSSLSDNRLENFLVRFIPGDDPVLSQRYSILVKQIALSRDAFFYYSTLKELSGSDNIFSQNQPGFVEGNIYNTATEAEKVIGYFNVSSVSKKRFYFDFEDFYVPYEDPRPTFATECNPDNPSIGPPPERIENLIELLELGYVKYIGPDAPQGEDGGPWRVVEAPCVDCNYFGTNVKPDFWEDED